MNAVTLKKLKNEVLEPISYYMKNFNKNFLMSRHLHPYIEIMYCRSEHFTFEVYEENDEGQKVFNTYIVSPGEFVIIDAMVPHRLVTDIESDSMIYNVEFEVKEREQYNPYGVFDAISVDYSQMMSRGGWAQIANAKGGYAILTDTENVEHCFRVLLNILYGGIDSFEKACEVQARQMMLFAEISKCKVSLRTGGCVMYIKQAQEFINKNYASDIRIEDVARHVKVNKTYLQRLFRTYTGTTMLRSINALRVGKAQQLLSESNLSMEQIAAQTGFKNRQHLIYEFKNQISVTPSDYRKQYQQQLLDHQARMHDSHPFKA